MQSNIFFSVFTIYWRFLPIYSSLYFLHIIRYPIVLSWSRFSNWSFPLWWIAQYYSQQWSFFTPCMSCPFESLLGNIFYNIWALNRPLSYLFFCNFHYPVNIYVFTWFINYPGYFLLKIGLWIFVSFPWRPCFPTHRLQ